MARRFDFLSNNFLVRLFKKSIRYRIIFSFASMLSVIIILGEMFILLFLNDYYYGGVEQLLKERVGIAAEFLNKYGEYSDLEGKSNFLFDTFLGESDKKFLVQTISKEYVLIMDSNGFTNQKISESEDIKLALENQIAVTTNVDESTNERTMSASRPLMRYGAVDGVVRYTVSLTKIDDVVRGYYATSMTITFIAIFLSILISALLSQSIVFPIERLISVARVMAKGNLDARAQAVSDDEVGELADTLNYLAEEIQKNDKMKKDFIASISHELRTPLTSIKGWGETLLSEEIEENSNMEIGLKIISSESDRLRDMVEELLDFSQLERHRMKVDKSPFLVSELLSSVYNQMLPRTKGIDFKLEKVSDDVEIYADANRLRQVLINLLANSIKFSKEDPKITLKYEVFDGVVLISVEDNGIGILPENLSRVKEKFFKENINLPGSGIGLALVDEIVKLHNGFLNIYSEPNVGTEVTIELPIEKFGD